MRLLSCLRPLISDELKCIFIHVPKAAGTTIRVSLDLKEDGAGPLFQGHVPWQFYRDNHPFEWTHYFKFACIRNPWSRFWSSYKYAVAGTSYWQRKVHLPHQDADVLKGVSFLELCKKFSEIKPLLKHPCWVPQAAWVYDYEARSIVVDKLIRQEYFEEDFKALCAAQGWEVELTPTNLDESGLEGGYKQAFGGDEEAIACVENAMFPDAELFGYVY